MRLNKFEHKSEAFGYSTKKTRIHTHRPSTNTLSSDWAAHTPIAVAEARPGQAVSAQGGTSFRSAAAPWHVTTAKGVAQS